MLPDFPDIKKQIENKFIEAVKQHIGSDPIVGQVKKFFQHEGRDCSVEQVGGRIIDFDYQEARGTFSVDDESIIKLTIQELLEKARQVAAQILEKQHKMLFERIEEAVEQTGNKIQGEFDAELMLSMLERIQIVFQPDGSPVLPTIVAGPALSEKINAELKKLETNEAFQSRFSKVISQKRGEWRADESRRKLVS